MKEGNKEIRSKINKMETKNQQGKLMSALGKINKTVKFLARLTK